jgi:hypothetical protein
MRRVRATFLLRCLILAGCLALCAAVFSLGIGIGWTAGTVVVAAVIWVVGIEGGLLPLAIERVVARRAARSGTPTSSIWFMDLDQQRRRQAERFQNDTRDNPTIR